MKGAAVLVLGVKPRHAAPLVCDFVVVFDGRRGSGAGPWPGRAKAHAIGNRMSFVLVTVLYRGSRVLLLVNLDQLQPWLG